MKDEITLQEIEKGIEKLAPQDQLKLVEELIHLFRENSKINFTYKYEKIVFATRKSDVIGSLTREEIYDYL